MSRFAHRLTSATDKESEMNVCNTLAPVVLESAAQALVEASAKPPYLS